MPMSDRPSIIVLDTNVLSELARKEGNQAVIAWVERHEPRELWITSTTASELVLGIRSMPAGRRRDTMESLNHRLLAAFYDATLSFETNAATAYGTVVAERKSRGRPITRADAQIAASCLVNNATLATRNTRDFEGIPGLEVINPWEAES